MVDIYIVELTLMRYYTSFLYMLNIILADLDFMVGMLTHVDLFYAKDSLEVSLDEHIISSF